MAVELPQSRRMNLQYEACRLVDAFSKDIEAQVILRDANAVEGVMHLLGRTRQGRLGEQGGVGISQRLPSYAPPCLMSGRRIGQLRCNPAPRVCWPRCSRHAGSSSRMAQAAAVLVRHLHER